MKNIVFFLLFTCFSVLADIFPIDIRPEKMKKNDWIGSIRILDQRELIFGKVGKEHFSEISDLTYLPKRRWLFMVSDEGRLFRFRARFGNRILELTPQDGEKICRSDGRKLTKAYRDSEGVTFDDQGRLYVSFEGKPRIARISYDGRILRKVKLPKKLDSVKVYRGRNRGLEALIWHPKYGLVTAPEEPLKSSIPDRHTLYGLHGEKWSYRRQRGEGAITALEVLPNGNFLILERNYTGLSEPVSIVLRELELKGCGGETLCSTRILARLNSAEGWAVDNFEGLAYVGNRHYIMISDDNDNLFQKTILLYFEIVK